MKKLKLKILFILSIFISIATLVSAQQKDPKFGTIKVRKYGEQKFFLEIEQVPRYVDGPNALLDDIQRGIVYPESAISQSLDGTVMVAVIIDKFGNVINTSIHSSPHKSLNTAALAAAKLLKKFEPHLEKGQVVPAKFILPVRFILPL